MATRWMKWNEGTHIFEYSTDGVTFNPLPLDASILTQGVIDPARLPPGLPNLGGDNVYTGAIPISIESAAPFIQFKETDQGVDLKNWRLGVENQLLGITTYSDALAAITTAASLNRSGGIALPSTGGLDMGGALQTTAKIRYRSAGNFIEWGHGNPGGYGSTIGAHINSGAPFIAFNAEAGTNPNTLRTRGTPGCGIKSNTAGAIQFFTVDAANADNQAETIRMTLGVTGNLTVGGTITERNRPTPMGEWISYTPTWSSSGTQPGIGNGSLTGRYTKIGKTILVEISFTFGSTSSTGTGSYGWSLPVTGVGIPCMVGRYLRSGSVYSCCFAIFRDTNNILVITHGSASQMGQTVPFTWTTNDSMLINGFYTEA